MQQSSTTFQGNFDLWQCYGATCVRTGTVCDVPHVSMSSNGLLVQGHGCAWTRAPAAITHFTVHLRNGSSSRLPGQVRRQEVSWEKRRKQKQRSLAAGSDLQPWPPTSPSISLTIRTLTKHRCANSMALPAICTYWRNRVFNSALRQPSL